MLKKEKERETEIERLFRYGFGFENSSFVLKVWFRYFRITT